MYTYIYVHIYSYARTHLPVCIYTYIYTCMYNVYIYRICIIFTYLYIYLHSYTYIHVWMCTCISYFYFTRHLVHMGWLRLVGSLKLQVSFAKDPSKRDDVLQKRPIISRSLLIVATSYDVCIPLSFGLGILFFVTSILCMLQFAVVCVAVCFRVL